MSDDQYRRVPSARLARLAVLGQLAGGLAASALAEGARRFAKGERPRLSDLLLTPANAHRVTDQLSRLRGAAMKLGQMMSLDAGDLLPPELTAILSRLREAAHYMPPGQLNQTLTTAWGPDWLRRFRRFDQQPIAAASIGQVHRAILADGASLAIKVQYPGVADSIDADVDNVASLLRLSNMLPATLDLSPLLAEARRQLHEEADYIREARQLQRFRALLSGDDQFVIPEVYPELSTQHVLAMSYVPGKPVEALREEPQDTRNRMMGALIDLVLRELFEFGFMQTDPNFANYRWQPDTGRIVLLDFGATRETPHSVVLAYRRLLRAALTDDQEGLRTALLDHGFVSPAMLERHRRAIDGLIAVMMTHFSRRGDFNFADRSFIESVRSYAEPVISDRTAWHIPPTDTLFVQRKVSGIALLGIQLQAVLPLREIVEHRLGSEGA